eukprot:CAMPEP_0184496478 /NCGR_PEP_ID=MMETSP0113_2-20130426/34043_1 /TAXON_ID=91329 /ORGANISM="Norrisiella sphaerica, Strain BC52" /LENGTH=262 /DNA_ID=CAMNT_0026883109 /DNA_START=402 /DNA_END=1187 /DNA_ORIENTATION=+
MTLRTRPKANKRERRFGLGASRKLLANSEHQTEGDKDSEEEDRVPDKVSDLPCADPKGAIVGSEWLYRGKIFVKVVKLEKRKGGDYVATVQPMKDNEDSTAPKDSVQARGSSSSLLVSPLTSSEPKPRVKRFKTPLRYLRGIPSKTMKGASEARGEKPRKNVILNEKIVKPSDRDRCDRTLRKFFSGKRHFLIGEQAIKAIRKSLGGNRGRVMDLMRVLASYGKSKEAFEKGFRKHVEKVLPETSPARKRIDEIKRSVKQEW